MLNPGALSASERVSFRALRLLLGFSIRGHPAGARFPFSLTAASWSTVNWCSIAGPLTPGRKPRCSSSVHQQRLLSHTLARCPQPRSLSPQAHLQHLSRQTAERPRPQAHAHAHAHPQSPRPPARNGKRPAVRLCMLPCLWCLSASCSARLTDNIAIAILLRPLLSRTHIVQAPARLAGGRWSGCAYP